MQNIIFLNGDCDYITIDDLELLLTQGNPQIDPEEYEEFENWFNDVYGEEAENN